MEKRIDAALFLLLCCQVSSQLRSESDADAEEADGGKGSGGESTCSDSCCEGEEDCAEDGAGGAGQVHDDDD